MSVSVIDVAPDLWLWRQPHPDWHEGADWDAEVTSVALRSDGVGIVLDPLAPPPSAREAWERIEELRPEVAVVLKPDHVRDVDLFARWYGARPFGPFLFWANDLPRIELEPIRPGDRLPGGVHVLDDGRGAMETPVYLPQQRTLVFADGMTAPDGVLRVWASPRHHDSALPTLRGLLELPFDRVIVSHGAPVHPREEFERALEREPYGA